MENNHPAYVCTSHIAPVSCIRKLMLKLITADPNSGADDASAVVRQLLSYMITVSRQVQVLYCHPTFTLRTIYTARNDTTRRSS